MIQQIVAQQRAYFQRGETQSYQFRRSMLQKLEQAVQSNEGNILGALHADLNKPDFEGYMTELGLVLDEIRVALRHLKRWMTPKRCKTPLTHFGSTSRSIPEPYGVALIMAPWNYPFSLSMEPLVGAIAAGNCAVLKPSAYAPATSRIIRRLIADAFPEEYIAVVEGGRQENQSLLEEHFDYIFFTGSVAVGKVVMEAASRHLTPVSLELGGKSPCIVDQTADLRLAAKRIVFGKVLNGGQTCVAPDYLLVQQGVKGKLVEELGNAIKQAFPGGDFSSMVAVVNDHHYRRLVGLMEGERVLLGGKGDKETRILEPTLLDGITWDSPIMQEEIFGPILPILAYGELNEAIEKINSRPKPLALYLFSRNREAERAVLGRISFGGGCVNDTIMHAATPHMGFGGVGDSGMGSYHGKYSFDAFSHHKGIIKRENHIDPPVRYRPYSAEKLRLLKKILN